jgi:hypothetical protein
MNAARQCCDMRHAVILQVVSIDSGETFHHDFGSPSADDRELKRFTRLRSHAGPKCCDLKEQEMKKSFDDTGLSLFKGSDDATKLRAFELENKTRQQALRHQTLRYLCGTGLTLLVATRPTIVALVSTWI